MKCCAPGCVGEANINGGTHVVSGVWHEHEQPVSISIPVMVCGLCGTESVDDDVVLRACAEAGIPPPPELAPS